MALEGRRFRRRRKEQVFVEGYFLDHATDVLPGIDRTEETHNLFGSDIPETDVQQNVGSLSLNVLDKFANNAILDLITQQDPGGALPRQYRAEDITAVHVWANVKNAKNTAFIRSWIVEGWTPGMPYPVGGPEAKTAFQMQGPGNKPRMFEGAWIKSKKVASGASPTLGDTPVVVPLEANIYAVAVKAIYDQGGTFEQQDIPITATVVNSSGAIAMAEVLAAATEITGVTHVMAYYLQTGTGVYPTVTMGKLRS
jgi:hypothetical protein